MLTKEVEYHTVKISETESLRLFKTLSPSRLPGDEECVEESREEYRMIRKFTNDQIKLHRKGLKLDRIEQK